MAKNLSTFSPGMGAPSEMLDYCEYIYSSSGAPGDSRATDYGLGCGVYCFQTDHSYSGNVRVRFSGSGGSAPGACCCMISTPGGSGSYAIFEATPTTGQMLCWHVTPGGCCRPSHTSSMDECYQWIKDDQQDNNGRIFLATGMCSCGECSAPTCERNWHVCYEGRHCDEYTCTGGMHGSGSHPRYVCRNCFIADGGTNHWLDSDTEIYPSRLGFIATGKCSTTGSSVCKVVQFSNMPSYAMGKREYYMSMSFSGENCYGAWLGGCFGCHWWGAFSHQVASSKNIMSMCAQGSPGLGASANGGNCYCGGSGQAGTTVSIYYRLNSAPTG